MNCIVIEIFSVADVQLGLDLATSFALIVSAVGVMWRVGSVSKKLQGQQIEAIEIQAKKSLVEHRELARVKFLLETNQGLARQIRILRATFSALAEDTSTTFEHENFDATKILVQDCWMWIQEVETQLMAIGSDKQIEELQKMKRHFLGTVQISKGPDSVINTREMVTSLVNLQREILIDTRVYLLSETREAAKSRIDTNLTY